MSKTNTNVGVVYDENTCSLYTTGKKISDGLLETIKRYKILKV